MVPRVSPPCSAAGRHNKAGSLLSMMMRLCALAVLLAAVSLPNTVAGIRLVGEDEGGPDTDSDKESPLQKAAKEAKKAAKHAEKVAEKADKMKADALEEAKQKKEEYERLKGGEVEGGKAKDGKAPAKQAEDADSGKEGRVDSTKNMGKEGKGKEAGKGEDKIPKGSKEDVWFQATEHLKKYESVGAKVNQKLKADMVSIGGGEVRGIVTEEAMKNGTKLVVIPKKAWINLDNFPKMRDSSIKCPGENEVKIATAMAIEDKKADKSDWKAYLDTLPTWDDFHAFYPKWAEDDLLQDFDGLALVKDLKDFQSSEKDLKKCWESWYKTTDVPETEGLKWEDIRLELARWRSRNHNTSSMDSNHSHALLPAADLMNTGTGENTKWYFEDTDNDGHADQYTLELEGDAAKGDELLERYCAYCKNDQMLMIWGIYVEDNGNKVDQQSEGCEKLLSKAKPLLQDQKEEKLLSPRCKKETLEMSQGPMRCSLARLAWESCSEKASGDSKDSKESSPPPGAAGGKDGKEEQPPPPAPQDDAKVSFMQEGGMDNRLRQDSSA
eukprot:TRINITY_DN121294_c0_g1_i1.p1 TRINITY_DN121294_c0_g1~~TRINITY_DN121294_c0_g1_i1.p1  ORF type:complete len:553 (+),score=197.22 TRINITY_DN121294_c0_g1_i1:61-1719(+)